MTVLPAMLGPGCGRGGRALSVFRTRRLPALAAAVELSAVVEMAALGASSTRRPGPRPRSRWPPCSGPAVAAGLDPAVAAVAECSAPPGPAVLGPAAAVEVAALSISKPPCSAWPRSSWRRAGHGRGGRGGAALDVAAVVGLAARPRPGRRGPRVLGPAAGGPRVLGPGRGGQRPARNRPGAGRALLINSRRSSGLGAFSQGFGRACQVAEPSRWKTYQICQPGYSFWSPHSVRSSSSSRLSSDMPRILVLIVALFGKTTRNLARDHPGFCDLRCYRLGVWCLHRVSHHPTRPPQPKQARPTFREM